MKTIITTVGTSLFTNYKEKVRKEGRDDLISNYLDNLEQHDASSYDKFLNTDIAEIKYVLMEVEKDWLEKPSSSAEMQSIDKFIEENKDNVSAEKISVYLLATDTIQSCLAAEIICKVLNEKYSGMATFEPEYGKGIIEGLTVEPKEKDKKDPNFFDKGLMNLVERVKQLIDQAKAEKRDVVLNISGGYKGIIPVMTIVGQLEGVPLIYQYEKSNSLVKIGGMPLSIDWEIIKKFGSALAKESKLKTIELDKYEQMRKLYLVEGPYGNHSITFIGKLLAHYFKTSLPPFFEDVMGYFIEYKVEECYYNKYGRLNVMKSYNKNMKDGADIDILIQTNSDFIAVEIKPLEILDDEEDFNKKIIDGFCSRIKTLVMNEGRAVTEVWLILYSYLFLEEKETKTLLLENHKKMLQTVLRTLPDLSIRNFTFRVKHFYIKAKHDRFIHKDFLKSSLKETSIRDLFVEKVQ